MDMTSFQEFFLAPNRTNYKKEEGKTKILLACIFHNNFSENFYKIYLWVYDMFYEQQWSTYSRVLNFCHQINILHYYKGKSKNPFGKCCSL